MKGRRQIDPAEARLRLIRGVQAMRRKLELEDVEYRDLVERISGVHGTPRRSAGDCSIPQLAAIAAELRAKERGPGAKAGQQWVGRPKGDLAPQLAKIEALLADHRREWDYAHTLAQRICKVHRVEWCKPDQLAKIIAALQIDANRHPERSRSARRRGRKEPH